jgi:hypothetical protein
LLPSKEGAVGVASYPRQTKWVVTSGEGATGLALCAAGNNGVEALVGSDAGVVRGAAIAMEPFVPLGDPVSTTSAPDGGPAVVMGAGTPKAAATAALVSSTVWPTLAWPRIHVPYTGSRRGSARDARASHATPSVCRPRRWTAQDMESIAMPSDRPRGGVVSLFGRRRLRP